MDDKYKPQNKHWVWIIFLLLGFVLVGLAIIIDTQGDFSLVLGKQNVGVQVDCGAPALTDALTNVVFVYSAIVAAVVIFFYGVIDNNRLGVPYRLLMSYTIGSWTIPVLFFLTLILSALLPVISFFHLVCTIYIICGYVLLVDGFIIVEIFLATSFKHCKKEICKLETQKYIQFIGMTDTHKGTELSCFFGFFAQAINSEEYILHKREFLIDFLRIPFERKNLCRRGLWTRFEDADKIVRQQLCIYQFYYINIVAAFENFSSKSSHTERSLLYEGIYSFIKGLLDRLTTCKDDDEFAMMDAQLYRIAISGIVNGILASNVDEKDEFCNNILLNVIESCEEAKLQLQWLLLFQELLYTDNAASLLHLKKCTIDRFRDLLPVKETDIAEFARLWKIWVDMYAISEIDKMKHFRAAIYTMTGYGNLSRAIFEVLLSANNE